jgi:hypothetical protein
MRKATAIGLEAAAGSAGMIVPLVGLGKDLVGGFLSPLQISGRPE